MIDRDNIKITCSHCGNIYNEEGSCPKCGEPLKSNHIEKNFNPINQNENIPKVITDYYKKKITYSCIGFIVFFIIGNIIVNFIDIIRYEITLHSLYTFARFFLGRNIFLLVQIIILIISLIWIRIAKNQRDQTLRIIKTNLITSVIVFVLNIIFNYRLFFIQYCIIAGVATISDIISFYISNILLFGIIIFMIINVKKFKNKMC